MAAFFIRSVGQAKSAQRGRGPAESGTNGKTTQLWSKVPGAEVAALLGGMLFPEEARDVNAERLASYIRTQVAAGELIEWTVAVLAGNGEPISFGGRTFHTLERTPLKRGREGRYIVKTILAPRDEAIDLSADEYAQATALANDKRSANGKPSTDAPDGPEIRRARGRDPRRGLLLLYPLSPEKAELTFEVPIFGVVCQLSGFRQRTFGSLPLQHGRRAL